MMDGLNKTHAIKIVVMIAFLAAISVMLTASPERYVYGAF